LPARRKTDETHNWPGETLEVELGSDRTVTDDPDAYTWVITETGSMTLVSEDRAVIASRWARTDHVCESTAATSVPSRRSELRAVMRNGWSDLECGRGFAAIVRRLRCWA
jgi:hypothetical protein